GLSGISFARSLSVSPLIIFTTAYPEYAVEGFELDATDYLVKPYSFERFLKAVNRALERLRENRSAEGPGGKILVKADKKLYAVLFSEILFIEGQGDYIRIHTNQLKLMVHDTIKNFLESLPSEEFMRIHKSFVVNLKQIEFIEGNQVSIGEQTIPASPANRDELLSRFSSL
ncbi:MAG: response regulator transcription factor, partial [Bacteroidales bacterium]|nr:response regulator transcription factor [Bacteroidales bacterium]